VLVFLHFLGISAGKLCIEVTPASKIAFISEELCIGCGICVKVCNYWWNPFRFCALVPLCLMEFIDMIK
jgi:translation initiation factor RLI1